MKSEVKIDHPEPRWQALLALLAVGGIYSALPRALVVGPTWLLPVLIVALVTPTIVAHRMGRYSLNRILGITTSTVMTLALITSVVLLVMAVPKTYRGAGGAPLFRGLPLANECPGLSRFGIGDSTAVVRPSVSKQREFGSRSFVFPQMQIEKIERGRLACQGWRPHFIDYLFVAWTTSSHVRADRRAATGPLGQGPCYDSDRHFTYHRRRPHLEGRRRVVIGDLYRARTTSFFPQVWVWPQWAQLNFWLFTLAASQRCSSMVWPVSVNFEVEGQRTRRRLITGPVLTLGRAVVAKNFIRSRDVKQYRCGDIAGSESLAGCNRRV